MKKEIFPDLMQEMLVAWDDYWRRNNLNPCQEVTYTDGLIHGRVEALEIW